jgi:hypothetical protein
LVTSCTKMNSRSSPSALQESSINHKGRRSKSFHEKAGECQVGFSFSCQWVLRLSRAASVAILPSALFVERLSLGASWVFSFQWCCYLIIDLCSHRFCGSWAPGLSRSHLDSAVELDSSYPILRHGAYPFTVLIFFLAGLLSIAS